MIPNEILTLFLWLLEIEWFHTDLDGTLKPVEEEK